MFKKLHQTHIKNVTPYAVGLVKTINECPNYNVRHPKQEDLPNIHLPIDDNHEYLPNANSLTKEQLIKALILIADNWRINWDFL